MKNKHRYPDNWHDTIRPAILARDGFRCDDCDACHRDVGFYEGNKFNVLHDDFQIEWAKRNGKKVTKIHLQIAHLDQNPANNDYSNLRAKCPKCHLRFDNLYNSAKRKMRKQKP